jgi:hypothetical protein
MAPPAPSKSADGDAKPTDEPATPNAKPADEPADAIPTKVADAPAERQANFTEPAAPTKPADMTSRDDKSPAAAEPPAATKPPEPTKPAPTEPALLEPPPAAPVAKDAAPHETVKVSGAPSFSTQDLSESLEMAKTAKDGLMKGSLSDGRDVQRAKGYSYSILADLAQKVLFTDPSSSPDVTKLDAEADAIFRQVLADPHTREEVAQITPMWIASPHRRQGGVFFAGSVTGRDAKGSVTEQSIDLGGGKSLTVLMPTAAGEAAKTPASPVAVVGWIVDKPAEHVPGYTGSASQAIFSTKLIPLE